MMGQQIQQLILAPLMLQLDLLMYRQGIVILLLMVMLQSAQHKVSIMEVLRILMVVGII